MPKSFLAWVLFTLWNNVTVELGFLRYQFNADTNLFTAEAQRAQSETRGQMSEVRDQLREWAFCLSRDDDKQ